MRTNNRVFRWSRLHVATMLVTLLATSTGARAAGDDVPPPAPDDPDRERILRLQETLQSVVHGPVLGRVRTAVRVMEARSGRLLFARHSDVAMDPASNQKILATAAALLRLGNEFRYRTEVAGVPPDAAGVVVGDMILRGSGDPSLLSSDLERLADDLVARGVRRVRGDVVADRRYLGVDVLAPNVAPPLQVSRSAIIVRVRPGDKPRSRPHVFIEPAVEGLTVANMATTTPSGRTRIAVGIGSEGGRMLVRVAGRISVRHAGVVFRRRPGTPMLYAAALLHQALRKRGVIVDGAAVSREPPGAAAQRLLAAHASAPLPALLRPINKNSNNDFADRLLTTLGAHMYGGPPSMDKGVRALRSAMAELGVPDSAYHATNGSGLGHGNRLTAEALANLLRRLYLDPRIGPELMQSLSVGGVDGTTKHRFLGSIAAHRVRAKTGTLNGKSCLSGYVGDESEILVFSILADHIGRRGVNPVRKAQVRLVDVLMGYAKGLVGEPPENQAEPGRDFEAGDDVLDSEEEEAPAEDAPPEDSDKADDEENPDDEGPTARAPRDS